MWNNILKWIHWGSIRRVSFDILMLVLVFVVTMFLPEQIFPEMAKLGLLSIFISKLIFVSAGIFHAHISRKLIFPYINFEQDKNWWNNIMIIAWYVVIISAWARGG